MSTTEKIPAKVSIECTAKGWTILVLDPAGEVLYRDVHVMENRAHAKTGDGHQKLTPELFGNVYDDIADEMVDALEDLTFGPFGLSQVLMDYADIHGLDDGQEAA